MSRPLHVLCHCCKQCRHKLCKHGSCFGSVNMFEHTEQDTSSQRLWSNVLISMSSSRTSERFRLFRGKKPQTMKSCDFLYLAILGIGSVCYDNLVWCKNQSQNVVLKRSCNMVSDSQIVTLVHSVLTYRSARHSSIE